MSNNTFKINEDKTKFGVFNTQGNSENKYTIETGNNAINMSEKVKIISRTQPLSEQHIEMTMK